MSTSHGHVPVPVPVPVHATSCFPQVTLRGNVLPVGGIKEKVVAAHRAGIRDVIMPAKNEKDLQVIWRTLTWHTLP
eukprot:6237689-Prymnesium_polylepis.1